MKAKTPRATAPTVKAADGQYGVGQQLTLVCHTHGERVKGFFSANTPGGWNDLWYKTSDGHYVAAADLDTHTPNALGPDCGQPDDTGQAAIDAGSKVDAALLRANSAVGTDMFGPFGCARFVAWSYGVAGIGANTAKDFRNKLAGEGRIHMDRDFPRGALVFSENPQDGGNGHVDIAQGDGTFVSGGLTGAGHNVQVLNTFDPTPGATYLGWAEAPW